MNSRILCRTESLLQSVQKKKFITGNRPLTEWNSYVDTLKQMGIEDVVAVKQAWYDRTQEVMQ